MCGEAAEMKPEKKFYYKIHASGNERILAICDKEIAGKKFEEGEIVLHAKEEFYVGEEIGEEVIELFESASVINLLGKNIVDLAIAKGWVEKGSVLEIKGVKHAQIVKI